MRLLSTVHIHAAGVANSDFLYSHPEKLEDEMDEDDDSPQGPPSIPTRSSGVVNGA